MRRALTSQFLELSQIADGISDGVPDVTMPKVILNEFGIGALIGKSETAPVMLPNEH